MTKMTERPWNDLSGFRHFEIDGPVTVHTTPDAVFIYEGGVNTRTLLNIYPGDIETPGLET